MQLRAGSNVRSVVMGTTLQGKYLDSRMFIHKQLGYSIKNKLMCNGETRCAWNLNNNKIVVGFVVVDDVVVMATHTEAVPGMLRNKNCSLRGELAV